MSDSSADPSCCAYCGIAEVDEIKLKECDACDLVKYCGDECQQDHKSQHEEACKKRAAELRDEILFKQPESSHKGDCPICCLPFSLDRSKGGITSCCFKRICNGCLFSNRIREVDESLKPSCPFCRNTLTDINDEEELGKRRMKRIEANDPAAMYQEGEYVKSFEYLTKAAELGYAIAHYRLAAMYRIGDCVEKDEGKQIHHAEEAAIAGHPDARYDLGVHEWNNNDNAERAVKHWIIAAKLGNDNSIKPLMFAFKSGDISNDDLAATLRAHQAAVDATKSPQREAAETKKWKSLR